MCRSTLRYRVYYSCKGAFKGVFRSKIQRDGDPSLIMTMVTIEGIRYGEYVQSPPTEGHWLLEGEINDRAQKFWESCAVSRAVYKRGRVFQQVALREYCRIMSLLNQEEGEGPDIT